MTTAVEHNGLRSRHLIVSALGVLQIFGWGSTYYLPAVLSPVITADTGWSLAVVVGGLTIALLVSGLTAPVVGRAIQHLDARLVLAGATILLALGLTIVGCSQSVPVYSAGWVVIGLGMSGGLYDASFSALARIYGKDARSAITSLTLWGGFSSTICWPISAYLAGVLGWRGTLFVYALVHLSVCLPLMFVIPSVERITTSFAWTKRNTIEIPSPRIFALISAMFTVSSGINSVIAVNLIILLTWRDHDPSQAIVLGMLVGPSQFGARLLLSVAGDRVHPAVTTIISMTCIAAGILWISVGIPFPAIAVVIYGVGNGVLWIARGTLPLALFGASNYPLFMGRIALPTLIAQALAPSAGVFAIWVGGEQLLLVILCLLATSSLVLAGLLFYARPDAPKADRLPLDT